MERKTNVDINIVGTAIWACITLICLVCSVAAYANTVATKGDMKAIRQLLERLISSDTHPITVSRDSDIETLKQGQHRLEGAIVMLADRANGTDSREAIAILQAILEATRERPVVQYQPMENGKLPLSTIEIAPRLEAKRSPKVDMVRDWLQANPDKHNLSNREIAKLLGVTHPTVAEAKRVNPHQ